MLSYTAARQKVTEATAGLRHNPKKENVEISAALGRVLAEEVRADRDYPPFDRSTRDGYAVRSADCAEPGARLRSIGESKAGDAFAGRVGPGECVQIMTGAAVPAGADAVVMIEQTRPEGSAVCIEPTAAPQQNVVKKGSEAKAGRKLLAAGMRMGFAEMALAAQVGRARVETFLRPRLAILSTGDEVVAVDAAPGPTQIRNSNSVSLAAQATLAGAEAVPLGNAPDEKQALRGLVERGLLEDALVLSGGVSMGKYDLVEEVLKRLGTEWLFDGIAIRPGRPAVFGLCRGKPVFGLPGNPVSTMVTFELLVVPALDILGGTEARPLPIYEARLGKALKEKPPLAHFLPARVRWEGGEAVAEALAWQGSGDVAALAEANAFLVVEEPRFAIEEGERVNVLPRRDVV